jgi:hypothetical protein
MSLSNPREESPVKKFFKVRASTGDVVHYDKSLARELEQPVPFRFIVLDVLNTVGGFHEPSNSGIWSNEVRNSNKDVLIVRNKTGVLAEGPYSDIKDKLKAVGGKFANAVYLAYSDGSDWKLGKITFVGASVSAWFDFGSGKRFDANPGVVVSGFTAQKKGRTEYFVPEFDHWAVSAQDLSAATALDRDLQEFLSNAPLRTSAEEDRHGVTRVEPHVEPPVQQSFSAPSAPLSAAAPF